MKGFDFDKELKALSQQGSQVKVKEAKGSSQGRLYLLITILILVGLMAYFLSKGSNDKPKGPTSSLADTAKDEAQGPSSQDQPKQIQPTIETDMVVRTVKLIPTNPILTDTIKVEVDFVDKVDLSRYTLKYQWLINNTQVIEDATGDTLSASKLRRGDYVGVRLSVLRDGNTVQQVNSPMVMVQNSAPSLSMRIIKDKVRKGEPIEIQLTSHDIEGDRVTFRLEEAPSGMTIDQNTGRIVFTPMDTSSQTVTFRASVMDSEGAKTTATYEIRFSIQ